MLNKEIEYLPLLLALFLFTVAGRIAMKTVHGVSIKRRGKQQLLPAETNRYRECSINCRWPGHSHRRTNGRIHESGSSECNPIIIDGVMYATSARHRVYAVHANSEN